MNPIGKLLQPAALALLMSTTTATAQGVPTFDGSALQQFVAQLNQLQAMYDQATDQLLAVTGIRDFLAVKTAVENFDIKLPQNPLDSVVGDVLNGSVSGPLAGDITAALNDFSIPDLSVISTSTKPVERAAAQFAATASTAMAMGKAGEQESQQMLKRADALRGQVGSSADLKASVDLNTMVLTEMMKNQAMIVQLLSVQNINQGTQNLTTAQSALNGMKLRVQTPPELK